MVGSAVAGVAFAFFLIGLFEPLIWLEGTLAQALVSGNSDRVHFYYGFVVPLIDGTVCALLVGLPLGLIRMHARWLHVIIFFLAFYAVQLAISGVRLFTHLFVIAPFLWLFPIMTCLLIPVITSLRRRHIRGSNK